MHNKQCMCNVWIYQEMRQINIRYHERNPYGMMTVRGSSKAKVYSQKSEF
ncbi:hypothetical protein HanIR_Chr12g0593501 [Helianthus annuus]|nr:hypothetical protein HanIR_Chr12g0593501 [Helianthus annuus]